MFNLLGTVGRAELLCAIFVLLGVMCGSNASVSSSFMETVGWFAMATIFAICAILSKETGLTIFPLIGVYDLFLNVLPNVETPNVIHSNHLQILLKEGTLPQKTKQLGPFILRTVFLLACVAG